MNNVSDPNPFDDPSSRINTPAQNPHAILDECREVQRALEDLESQLSQLQRAQRGFVTGTGASNRDIDAMGAEIMSGYRAMGDRVKRIKSRPGTTIPHRQTLAEHTY